MHFECRFKYRPSPFEPIDYICPAVVDVIVHSKDNVDDETLGARLAIDHLDIVRVEEAGIHLLEVCDCDSAGWEEVYSTVIEPGYDFSEIRHDFGFSDPVLSLSFLYRAVFHPKLRDWQSYVIDHVCGLFGEMSATVMWSSTTDLSEIELAGLGFRKIAGSQLLFRPNMIKNNYSAAEDPRDVFELQLSQNEGKEVVCEWGESLEQ